jgi:hypothetical protein
MLGATHCTVLRTGSGPTLPNPHPHLPENYLYHDTATYLLLPEFIKEKNTR